MKLAIAVARSESNVRILVDLHLRNSAIEQPAGYDRPAIERKEI